MTPNKGWSPHSLAEQERKCLNGDHEATGERACICGSTLPWCMACGIHHQEPPNDPRHRYPHGVPGFFAGVHIPLPPFCRHCRCLYMEKP